MRVLCRSIIVLVIAAICGCTTKIENTYNITGNGNTIRATDTATATPTTSDVVDAAGTGSGSATTNGGL